MGSRHSLHTLLLSFRPRLLARSISSTSRVESVGWFDKIKGVFTGKSTADSKSSSSFSLIEFADQMDKARMLGSFRKFEVGRSSAAMSENFKKNTAILRYLGSIDPTGENLQANHKRDAIKHCNCTIADVEEVLAKYRWAKEAQKKIDKLKEEGKPLPKNFNELLLASNKMTNFILIDRAFIKSKNLRCVIQI
ncbi:uncharacterized protein LOC103714694 isoform X2 [Phoenix dactylifera]|uniref:Uncharacterized protein LOC103714694 isoform X2 n=1 Tax=Phoenix dactylifera TaxID=42345 RepID=A0A8B9AH46_PHODC|nr:uncharacterized protein LOC103714694 isoform X2 [Phoenix dactylifera]